MPADTRPIRDLALRLVAPRRITVLAGLSVLICQYLWYRGQFALAPVAFAGLAICLSNEVGHRLLRVVDRPRWVACIVNAQVAFDTLALVLVVHFTGGLASLGILLFAPVFFAYGAVLPVRYAFVHVALTATQLALLGMGERSGFIPHVGLGDFYRPDAYRDLSFVTLITVAVTTIEALCVYLSHYLSGLIGEQEEQSRVLAVARWDLLTRNESETARVRALLDVAQHMSATQTVDALLRAVCDTTATLGRVPRVEIFLWDEERQGLYLAAARGLAERPIGGAEVRRATDVPMIGRLRAGEVVQFHTGPSYASYCPGEAGGPAHQPGVRRAHDVPRLFRGSALRRP